jgi:hypothetical protein
MEFRVRDKSSYTPKVNGVALHSTKGLLMKMKLSHEPNE